MRINAFSVNSPYCLPYTSYFYLSFTDFQKFPGSVAFFRDFPVLENVTTKFQDANEYMNERSYIWSAEKDMIDQHSSTHIKQP